MRRRRRYEVIVEGLSGQAASQRSVISDHRSEAEARENARLERARLEVIYGDNARSWRIIVTRDDETIAVELPHGGARVAAVPPPEVPRPASEPAPAKEGPEGESGPVPDWLIARVEQSIARRRDRTYGPEGSDDDPGGSDDDPGGSRKR